MNKIYKTPFDWDFEDNSTLIYDSNSSKSEEEIKEMINQVLEEALEDTVDGAVEEAIGNMNIKLEGEDLSYKLIVNGTENGEINIPKDQFLKSTSYDREAKKLIFVMETSNGESTTEVEIGDLVSSLEDGVGQIQGRLTEINEKNNEQDTIIADKADISELDNYATKDDLTIIDEKIDMAVDNLATKQEMQEQLSTKANIDSVYTKLESDNIFQISGNYTTTDDYDKLVEKVAKLENYINIFIRDREEKMDEIINNMDSDNKEVIIETPMESIVIPETTNAYTITAPLVNNSTVELTSPKYLTLFNTSEEPVSTSMWHTFVEGESTSATSVYLVGNFDTLTLENISPAVKSGYDAATVNNVVISENNVKNLTLALDIQDGAAIINNSNANITIQDKNDTATILTVISPNSTVTLNGSSYQTLNAAVSDNTLIIKKNVNHIDKLNVTKGNVIVEVARQTLIDEKINEYTLADGYTIDYLHDEITSSNIANLTKEGTHILNEDITKTGNFSVGTFSNDDIIWDLNGHTITCSNTRGYGNFVLRGSAKLEINDSSVSQCGSVINDSNEYGFWTSTQGAKVVINGGYFEAATHVLYAEKGTIEVNGGTFKLSDWETADKDANGNLKFLLNCHDADYVSGAANIIVRGGKFYDFDPSNCAAEGIGTSFVADGYASVMTAEIIDGVEHRVYEIKPIN